MKSKIILALLLILSCEAIVESFDSVNGCYSIDNDGTKFNFYCSNTEKLFIETCAKTTLSESMQKLNTSAVTELKMFGCEIDTLVNAKKKLENVRVLDISHSLYGSERLFNLSIVDVLFNRKLVKLNAAHNNLTGIPDELFEKMPNSTVTDLSNNQLWRIKSTTFKGASQLEEIHLQQNELKEIEEGAFADTKVKYLDLRDNIISLNNDKNGKEECNISSLLNNPIVIYVSWKLIQSLDLRCIKHEIKVSFVEYESIRFQNGIVELDYNQNSFRNLRQIRANTNQMKNLHEIVSIVGQTLESFEELHVSGSDVMEIDFSILSEMKQVSGLVISNCSLNKVINPSVLQSIGIKKLFADGNQIQNVHEIIEHLNPSIEELSLSESFFGKLYSTVITKFRNLKELHLSNTNLQLVDSHYPFDQFENLTEIDISNNNFNKMNFTMSFPSKLEKFNASHCQIENVLDVIQLHGTKNTTLDLSGNFVGTLNGTTFDELENVNKLYLKNTSLTFPDSNPFHKLKNLEYLDISNNNLKNVNFTTLSSTLNNLNEFTATDCNIENAFDVIKLLQPHTEILDLSGNFVGKIDSSTFDKLTGLKEMYLRNTSFTIDDGSNPFEKLTSLHSLDISHNNLNNVNWTILSSTLSGLEELSVAECKIANALDFIKLLGSDVKHLDVSGNIVGQVNANTFAKFEGLNVLHLSNTSLLNFDFNVLEHSKDLNLLDISYNRFTRLNVSFKFDNLQTLNLRGCELTAIHNIDKFHFPKLKLLGISGNHLSCQDLVRLKNEWPRLEFIDNDQSQKDQPNCQKPIEKTTDISTDVLKPFTFRVIDIFLMITSAIFITAIVFLLSRYILCKKCSENIAINNDHCNCNNGIELEMVAEYMDDELVERLELYDHSNLTSPPSSALQQHHENASEPIDEPEIVSIAGELSESNEQIDD